MANHPSALKRVRSSEKRRAQNKYQHKTARTFIKRLRSTEDKEGAKDLYKKVSSMLDKLSNRGIIHRRKAANQKSKLSRLVRTD